MSFTRAQSFQVPFESHLDQYHNSSWLTLVPTLQLQSTPHTDESLKTINQIVISCHSPTNYKRLLWFPIKRMLKLKSLSGSTGPILPLSLSWKPHSCTPAKTAFDHSDLVQEPSTLRKPCPDYLVTGHHITQT